jgi:hypothetical protein
MIRRCPDQYLNGRDIPDTMSLYFELDWLEEREGLDLPSPAFQYCFLP